MRGIELRGGERIKEVDQEGNKYLFKFIVLFHNKYCVILKTVKQVFRNGLT